MQEQLEQSHTAQAAAAALPETPRDKLDMHYRAQALQHLRDRDALNSLMIEVLEGSRSLSIVQFDAVLRAHDLLGRQAADAVTCLGVVWGSEGVA